MDDSAHITDDLINPRRACAARVTVLGLSICVYVCLYVCLSTFILESICVYVCLYVCLSIFILELEAMKWHVNGTLVSCSH